MENNLRSKLSKKEAYHEDKYRTLMSMSQDELTKCRKECDHKVKSLVDGFKRDMKIIDTEVNSNRLNLNGEIKELKSKLATVMQEN